MTQKIDDVEYFGFFYVEGKALIKINLCPAITNVTDITGEGRVHYGNVSITNEGRYAKLILLHTFDIYYTWDPITVEYEKEIKNLLYIDPPITVPTWFGLSSKTYHPPGARYIIDSTGTVIADRKYFNAPIALSIE